MLSNLLGRLLYILAVLSFSNSAFSFSNSSLVENLQVQLLEIGVRLSWEAPQEDFALAYIIEKSEDRINYQVLTQIEADATIKEQGYDYLDLGTSKELSYYRLTIVFKDGEMASLEPVAGFSKPGANFQINRFTGGEDSKDVVLDMSFLTGGLLHYSVERLDG
ncbi:MAG: hypothetical protein HKN16_09870, partial [Saprospiraceae bacterium]|nr:hypothetical protein [Saprospiraceae bacterium]